MCTLRQHSVSSCDFLKKNGNTKKKLLDVGYVETSPYILKSVLIVVIKLATIADEHRQKRKLK